MEWGNSHVTERPNPAPEDQQARLSNFWSGVQRGRHESADEQGAAVAREGERWRSFGSGNGPAQ
jgi:hypothetical protein